VNRRMLQCVIYFVAGGTLAALVAYLAGRGNPFLTAVVGSIPIMFLLNVYLVYRAGGLSSSLAYSKGVLLLLPAFILFVIVTMWLLPRLGMPKALLPGIIVYPVLALISQAKKRGLPKGMGNNDKGKNNKRGEVITDERQTWKAGPKEVNTSN
jgi:uncharacterized membrane protein (GlpM family)